MTPWHVPSSIWVHLGPWGSIFLVKNQFSHIFPASAWSPYQSLFLRYEVEKGLRAVYMCPDFAFFMKRLEAFMHTHDPKFRYMITITLPK